MSFRPERTGIIQRLYFYVRTAGSSCDSSSSGYGGGNGGTVHVDVYAAAPLEGLPMGPSLSSEEWNACSFTGGNQAGAYISPNLAVHAGELYVAVVRNADPSPTSNWFSTNHNEASVSGIRPDLAYVGSYPGERVRFSSNGGSTWDQTGAYNSKFPTYLIRYADASVQGHRTKSLWGDTTWSSTSVTVDYPEAAGKTVHALGAYSKSGGGASTLSLVVDGQTVRTESIAVSRAWEFGRVNVEAYAVPAGASVQVRASGSLAIHRSGSERSWVQALGLPEGEAGLYSYSLYPFVT